MNIQYTSLVNPFHPKNACNQLVLCVNVLPALFLQLQVQNMNMILECFFICMYSLQIVIAN